MCLKNVMREISIIIFKVRILSESCNLQIYVKKRFHYKIPKPKIPKPQIPKLKIPNPQAQKTLTLTLTQSPKYPRFEAMPIK